MHQPLHTCQPDIETSSEAYARRFSGETGKYFLARQLELFLQFLPKGKKLRILEVGGGHGQMTGALLKLGHEVVIHGSADSCQARIASLLAGYPSQLSFVRAELEALPFPSRSFDVVSAFRLLPHILSTPDFLAQLCTISRSQVIFDYAPKAGFNALTPLLFPIKKLIEKNTREYFCHSESTLIEILMQHGFQAAKTKGQFVIPMGIHRALKNAELSQKIEALLQKIHCDDLIGSPRIMSAFRTAE